MADWKWGDQFGADDDDENEEEGGEYSQFQWGQRDGVIFLIDVTKPMFEKGEDDTSSFELCIKCAKNVIQNKIISSDKDLLGIVFFGTVKEKNPSDFKHVYILHDLDQPGAEQVLKLEDLLNVAEDDNDDFVNQFGHSESFSLSDALWTCSNMFSNCTQKLRYKRVMLFTCNDNPHGNDAQLKRQAAAKAEDLHQNGIAIELMHMMPPDGAFNVNTFYKDMLYPDEDETAIMADAAEKFDDLLTKVRSKDHKKRAICRLPLTLGPGLKFAVGVYSLVRTCSIPTRVRLYKKTNEEIKTVSKIFLEETGEVLMPQDTMQSQTYGGEKISFEQEEVAEIKKFDEPGLLLMGFKPFGSIKRYFHIKPAQFIYPDETTIEGSTSVFSALLKKCLERSVVAICRYIARKNTPPRFVALLPQKEELDEHNVQVAPPGFHVLFIPFADDFRKIKLDEDLPRANLDQIDKAKELIKKLQFTFRSESFENPVLQKHYASVEAMALDRDEPEDVTDYTLPNQAMMERRAGRILEEFKDLVFPADYEPGAKRRGGAASGAAKKPKIEMDIDIEKEARANRLGKLTVAVLKDYIKKLKIQPSGQRKADLIDTISDYFGL